MKHLKLIVMASAVATSLFLCWLLIGMSIQQRKMISVSNNSFVMAIAKEKKLIISNLPRYTKYNSQSSFNNISYEEKIAWCDQTYIASHDDNRIFLDSLFAVELYNHGIQAETAIRCWTKEHTTYSRLDTHFYKSAIALDPVVYRLNEKPEGRMELQAYVKFPFGSIIKKVDYIEIIIALWLLSILVIIGGYWYLHRKRPIPEKKEDKQIPKLEKEEFFIKHPQMDVGWIQLIDDLVFNRRLGILKKGEVSVTLIGNALKLFNMFLNAPNNSLTYNDISVRLLHRSPVELSKSDLSAVFSTVKRFRDDLIAFPCIEVELLRRRGYRMFLFTEQEVAERSLAKQKAEEEKRGAVKSEEQNIEESDLEEKNELEI